MKTNNNPANLDKKASKNEEQNNAINMDNTPNDQISGGNDIALNSTHKHLHQGFYGIQLQFFWESKGAP